MTLRAIKDNLKLSSWEAPFKESFASLSNLEQPTFDALNELLLSIALGDMTKDIRNAAKKILRTRGSETAKRALKLKSSRNYSGDAGRKKLPADLIDLEAVEGFDVSIFAKYLYVRNFSLRAGLEYFFQHGTREAFREYFQYDRVAPDGIIEIRTAGNSPGRAVEALFDVLPSIEKQVVLIEINGKDQVDLDFSKLELPKLYELSLRLPLKEIPKGLFSLVHLRQLFIHSNLEEIPEGLGRLQALTNLGLGCPLRRLPDDFEQLRGLLSLNIDGSKLESLPDYLGEFRALTSMYLRNNTLLSKVPSTILELPKLSDGCKQHLRETFFSQNEYERLFHHLDQFVAYFNDVPSVHETLEAYETRQDCSRMGELILASSRCYYDDEHGLSSNDFYSNQIEQYGPEALKEANRAIGSTRFIDDRTTEEELHTLRTALGKVAGFDEGVFIDFVNAMVNVVREEFPFEKW